VDCRDEIRRVARLGLPCLSTRRAHRSFPQCAQLDRIPSVTFESGDTNFYTLLLLDPDSPSIQAPADRSVVVAMVINIPGG
jgi:hypothetical protein